MNTNLAGHYVLTGDIDASATSTWVAWQSAKGFTPIGVEFVGTVQSTVTDFTGSLEGAYSTINGFYQNIYKSNIGLFGEIGETGSVSRLTMNGTISGTLYVGAIAGSNKGTLTEVNNIGTVSGTGEVQNKIGGIAGINSGTISNAQNNGNITGSGYIGGIIGESTGGTLTNLVNTGIINGSSIVGGLVGGMTGGSLMVDAYGGLKQVTNSGAITGTSAVGGIVGQLQDASLSGTGERHQITNTGAVTGGGVGGIIGSVYLTTGGNFKYSYLENKGTILNDETPEGSSGYTGGVIGSINYKGNNTSNVTVSYVINDANVTSNAAPNTGGVIGSWGRSADKVQSAGTMTYVVNNNTSGTAKVKGVSCVGGVIGLLDNKDVTYTVGYNMADVTGTGDSVGGIVGDLKTGSIKAGNDSINNSGKITGVNNVGGIVGYVEYGTSYMVGDDVIKFVPIVESGNGNIYNSDSGTITGVTNVGGIVGYNSYGGVIKGTANIGIANYGDVNSTDTSALSKDYFLNLTAGGRAGGIVGQNSGKVSYVVNNGAVSGTAAIGGVAGYNTADGTIKQGVNRGSITSTGTNAEAAGGVVGYNNGNISKLANTGTVSGVQSVGGVVGLNTCYLGTGYSEDKTTKWDAVISSSVDSVYNSGPVEATGENVGGVAGLSEGGNFTNAYNTGTVSGTKTGGLIGKTAAATFESDVFDSNWNPTGAKKTTTAKNTITNSYNTGAVTGTTVGGLVGSTDTGTIVNSSFYATTNAAGTAINGTNDSGLGTAKTLEQMKQAALYADWDLDSTGGQDKVWRIYQGGTTPLLKNWLTKVMVSGLSNQSVVYDGAAHAPDVTGVTYNPEYINLELIKTVSGTATGSYAMLYSTQDGYDLVNDPTFTISKAVLKFVDLNTSAPADYTYGASVAPVIDWNFTGFTGGDTYETAAKSGSVSFDTSAAFSNGKTANAGTYTYSYNGDLVFDNYKFTTDTEGHGTGSITVNQASLTVAAGVATGNGVYGSDPTGQLGYTVSGLKYDDTAAVLSGTPTYTTAAWNSTTGKTGNAGTYSDVVLTALGTLTATNYKLTADSVTTGSITLDKAAATVTPNAIGSVTYGNTAGITANYDYTISGLVNGDSSAAGLTGAPTYTTEAVNGTKTNNVGTYDLTAATGTLASTNYSFSGATKADAITITKATVTVSATNVAHDVTYGDTDIASNFGYSVNGLVNGDTATVISGAPTYTTTAWNGTKTGNAGTYTDITASGQGSLSSANYEFTIDNAKQGSVTITPANLTLTADKVTMRDGDVLPSSFGGSVSGYVNGDSAIDMPLFVYDGSGTPTVGTHGILGYLGGKSSGLYGTNYYVLQGAGNGSALTVTSRIGSTDYARAISSLVPRHGNQIVTSLYGIWVSQPASTVEAREVGGSRLELAAGYYVDLDNKRHYL